MGIEPTRDCFKPHTGFEDQGRQPGRRPPPGDLRRGRSPGGSSGARRLRRAAESRPERGQALNAWEVYDADLGWGTHPVVIVSHPARAARKEFVEILDCASQRADRPAREHEVVLDVADGLDWPTFCKCDCIYAVPRQELENLVAPMEGGSA
jgi:hypothetical protein